MKNVKKNSKNVESGKNVDKKKNGSAGRRRESLFEFVDRIGL